MPFRLTPQPKPPRGEYRAEKQAKRAHSKASERAEKEKVRRRDIAACKGYCRWPGCKVRTYLEVSHCQHKSMGGNPTNDRSVSELMILLCQPHHRGSFSVDSGDLEIRPLTSLGMNGPCDFWKVSVDPHGGRRMVRVAYETSIGVYAHA